MFNKMRSINLVIEAFCILGLMFFSVSTGNTQEPNTGLVLYYTFDEEDVDEIIDQSGNDNNAIVKGQPEWIEGKIGKALKFVANQDYLQVPFSETLIPEKAITMAMWINFDGVNKLPSKWGGVIIDDYKWDKDPKKARGYFFGIEKANPGMRGSLLGTNGAEHSFLLPYPEKEKWTHVALTWDGSGIRGYVNGEPIKDKFTGKEVVNWKGPIGTNQVEDLFIASKEGQLQGFPGALDEVAIYNRGLSADEVKSVMDQGHVMPVEPTGKLAITWGYMKINQ